MNVLITGPDRDLARYLVEHYAMSGHHVWCRSDPAHLIDVEFASSRPDQVWWLTGACPPDREPHDIHLHHVLTLMTEFNVGVLHHVAAPLGYAWRGDTALDVADAALVRDRVIREHCQSSGIRVKSYVVPLLVADQSADSSTGHVNMSALLDVLHGYIAEVRERVPEYFDFRALKCVVREDARVHVLPIVEVVRTLAALAQRDERDRDLTTLICSDDRASWAQVFERMSDAYELSIVASDRASLNLVDTLFHDRLGPIADWLTGGTAAPSGSSSWSPDERVTIGFGEAAQIAVFRSIRDKQDERRRQWQSQTASALVASDRHTVQIGSSTTDYHVLGPAGDTPVVLINAPGQELQYWMRLIHALAKTRQVVLWRLRDTTAPGADATFADHLDELEAILGHLGAPRCHLVGWCSGFSVAARFSRLHPATVASLVCLNGTFKCMASSSEFETAYERDTPAVCQLLDRHPSMAASVIRTLRSSVAGSAATLLENDDDETAREVLSQVNVHLRAQVVAPFRDEPAAINYARQLLSYLAYDPRDDIAEIEAPVLVVGSSFDRVASVEVARQMAAGFRNATFVAAPGSTHYLLYDRPDLVAACLTTFFDNRSVMNASAAWSTVA
jgi:pimeloyl-ACP methyl ester carboxylesterase